jgi:hypothetical protein
MSAHQKAFEFSHAAPCFVTSAVSIFILGVILFWTLEHTDIVAFVTVLVATTILEAIFLFSLLAATSIPENNAADQRVGGGMSLRLIFTKMATLPKLLRKS